MDAVDAMDVERSDIPTHVGAMDAGAQRRPRTGDSRVGAVDAVDTVDAMDVERSDIPANAGAVDAMDAGA